MKKASINIILTGGTIDFYWNGISDTAVALKEFAFQILFSY